MGVRWNLSLGSLGIEPWALYTKRMLYHLAVSASRDATFPAVILLHGCIFIDLNITQSCSSQIIITMYILFTQILVMNSGICTSIYLMLILKVIKGVVAHAFNPSTQEAKV